MYRIKDLYDLDHTLARDYLAGFTFPWEALKGIKDMVTDLIKTYSSVSEEEKKMFGSEEAIGKCPKCGGDVVVGKYGAYCTEKCGMSLGYAMGRKLDEEQIKKLLAGEKIFMKGLKSKKGKTYDAFLKPEGVEAYDYTNKDGEDVLITSTGTKLDNIGVLKLSVAQDGEVTAVSGLVNELSEEELASDAYAQVAETVQEIEDQYAYLFVEEGNTDFDMVIYDRRTHSCKIFEIKHSRERVDSQYRHLINETYCRDTEQQFGTITEKTVLYRGESHDESNDIRYRNVSEYLKGL